MTQLSIRDVPDEDRDVLMRRAAAQGRSLNNYLRDLIHRDASSPTLDEVLNRVESREPVDISTEDIVDAVRGDRANR